MKYPSRKPTQTRCAYSTGVVFMDRELLHSARTSLRMQCFKGVPEEKELRNRNNGINNLEQLSSSRTKNGSRIVVAARLQP